MKKINIRKILVPIDFSNNSMNALQTAVAVAKRHNAMLHLLYVDDCDYDLYQNDIHLKPLKLTEYMKTLTQLAKSVINNDDIKCSYSSETGSITHCILKTSLERNSDLIVMGKNGTNTASVEYAGTHACQVAEKSRIPVIIVPQGVAKYNFENILFPVRPMLSVADKYDAIRPLILKNNPEITLLNLRNPDYENELHIIHRLTMLMKMKLEEDNVSHTMEYYFKDNKFAEHVTNVIADAENKFDLLVITTDVDRFNRDFYISNYAQKVIHLTEIPVLVIHPESVKIEKDALLLELEKGFELN